MKKRIASLILSLVMTMPAMAAVDLNTATQAELEAIKGIGPAKAKAIMDYRAKNGEFRRVGQLAKIKGFGQVSLRKLKDQFFIAESHKTVPVK